MENNENYTVQYVGKRFSSFYSQSDFILILYIVYKHFSIWKLINVQFLRGAAKGNGTHIYIALF